MPVKMLYSCLLVYADLALTVTDLCGSDGAHAQGLVKMLYPKTCSTRWKERDYSPEPFDKRVVDKHMIQ